MASTRSSSSTRIVLVALAAMLSGMAMLSARAEKARAIPPPATDEAAAPEKASESVVLAGGCFWGVQGVFQHLKGVSSAVSGYAGGSKASARYERVSTGTTGHAESVRVTFDPRMVSLGKILQVYFSVAHDPTQLNRQGPDVGTQYRSAIFYTTPEQKATAERVKAEFDKSGRFNRPIVTEITPASKFYSAEEYHQKYLVKHPGGYTCHVLRD